MFKQRQNKMLSFCFFSSLKTWVLKYLFGLTWQQFLFLIVIIVLRFSLYSSKCKKNFLIDCTFWKFTMLNDILTSLLQNIKYMTNIKWNSYHLNVKNVTYPSWREMCIILHFKWPFRSIIVLIWLLMVTSWTSEQWLIKTMIPKYYGQSY